MIEIISPSNKSMKKWRLLLTGRGIKKHRKAIASGGKVISEILINKPEIITECIISMRGHPPPSGLPAVAQVFRLKSELFRELDLYGTKQPLLVVNVPELKEFNYKTFKDKILLLVPFQDPANVGAVIRSASAFGVKQIMLLQETAAPFHPKSIRASGAQVFNVDFIKGVSIFDLGRIHLPIVALSSDGVGIDDFEFPDRFALLAGMEGPGLPDNLLPDFKVSIPMKPGVESLNAAVASSIALYEWNKRNGFH